jgi:hypothetical protein
VIVPIQDEPYYYYCLSLALGTLGGTKTPRRRVLEDDELVEEDL